MIFSEGDGVYLVWWDGCTGEIAALDNGRLEMSQGAIFSAQNSWISGFRAQRIGDL